MKRVKTIGILLIILLITSTCSVFAAEPQVSLNGESSINAGESKKISLTISSDTDSIGAVEGKIEHSSNISGVTAVGQNGWTITYNPQTGVFNGVKAEGTKNEAIMEITYTVKPGATGDATITASGLLLTTINYEDKQVADVTKTVNIIGAVEPGEKTLTNIKITKEPAKTSYAVGEKFSTNGMVVTAEYSDGTTKVVTGYTYAPNGNLSLNDTKITVTYEEGGITKTAEQEIKVTSVASENQKPIDKEQTTGKQENTNTANKLLPQTGVTNIVTIIMIAIVIVAIVSYIKYKKYKEI